MKNFQNESLLDRLARTVLGALFLLVAIFWVGGVAQAVLYVLGAIALFTAITGFCALYKLTGFDSFKKYPQALSKKIVYSIVAFLILLATVGVYYSNFFTRKFFLEDYNRMNNYYKQALFYTGQDKRQESIDNYEKLVIEYGVFEKKYSSYHPYVIKGDSRFNQDLGVVAEKIAIAKKTVYDGDLPALHKDLEQIRPIFQEMLKRNGFSMLAVALVDFHDVMEKVIEAADAKNPQGVIEAYAEADNKLKAVEETANDDEIKVIRVNLDAVLEIAKNGKAEEMSKKASELKSSFVKVYLKRG